jgi:hypothetical protein
MAVCASLVRAKLRTGKSRRYKICHCLQLSASCVQSLKLTELLGIRFDWSSHINPPLNALLSATVPTSSAIGNSVDTKSPDPTATVVEKASSRTADWANSHLLENLPTADQPVVLLSHTAADEPYDILLKLYRESNVPLVVAISLLTEEEMRNETLGSNEHLYAQLIVDQQLRAAEWFFRTVQHESS